MTSSLAAPAQTLPSPEGREGWAVATTGLALLCLVLTGMRHDVFFGLTTGLALAVVLLPLWAPWVRSSRWITWMTVLGGAAAAWSIWLTVWHSDSRVVSNVGLLESVFVVLGLVCGVGCALWARSRASVWVVGAVFGIGMLLGVNPSSEMYAESPWRFGFSLPVTIIVLAVAARWRSRWVDVVAVLALAGVSAVSGGRSTSAILLLVALLVLWQSWGRPASSGLAALRTVILFGTLALGTYFSVQTAILEGALGESAQARTELQLATSGTLITGGRPEIGATAALMSASPGGFGGGSVPSMTDLLVAKSGMAALGYEPNNGYVENYMFGSGFELHSVIGDLWAWCGIPGLVLAAVLLVFLVARTAVLTTGRAASALLLFLGVKSVWNLLFAPLESALPILVLAVALMAPLVRPVGKASG
ncbi:hypothetical protein [Promicromonospora umidemergens]|uniref:hypothetical protein n=1 Tax=Promicromonospora umidemergens TaxID=629679 RepID=UPI0020A5A225|nr:hypothetical protein [Promicromonospora umidemergens]